MKQSKLFQTLVILALIGTGWREAQASGAVGPAKTDLTSYVSDTNSIKLYPAESPNRAIDLQVLRELNATAARLNIHSPVVYRAVLNASVGHFATNQFLAEEDNVYAKNQVVNELKKNLENFINTGAIESISSYLNDPKNKAILGDGWRADPLLQQLTLELLAKWEGEQVNFLQQTASSQSLPIEVLGAYDARCTRELRTIELLYQMTGDTSPVGIETQNGYLLLYQIFYGSLLRSSGCPAQILKSRHFNFEDQKLPFGLPNIRPEEGIYDGKMSPDQLFYLRGIKSFANNTWGSWHTTWVDASKDGYVEWLPYGYMNFSNKFRWVWNDYRESEYRTDSGVVDYSNTLLQGWH